MVEPYPYPYPYPPTPTPTPNQAQWWSVGQRVLVLAGRRPSPTATPTPATTPTPTTTTTTTTTTAITTSTTTTATTPPALLSPLALERCARPGRELRAFEAAARNLSAQLRLAAQLGDAMGDAVRRRFYEFKGTPRACARPALVHLLPPRTLPLLRSARQSEVQSSTRQYGAVYTV